MMKVIVVFEAFISEWETSTWPPSILQFYYKRDALSSVYKISMNAASIV
jgi:hypothetical protein